VSTIQRYARRRLPGLLVLAVACPCPALATGTEPIRIEYRADRGLRCPSAQEFADQVFARTLSARPASETEPARTFIVELRRKGARIAGALVVEETEGASTARHVTGSECGHVASVLALATALAIDPHAELAPHQELEPVPATGPTQVSPAPAEALPEGGREHWSARASLGASAAFGIAPAPSFGPYASLAFRRERALFEELGLGLVFRTGAPELVGGARADFLFYAAKPTLCLRGLELTAKLHTAPCLSFEAGGVTGVGSDLPVSSRETRFWAASEALLRLEQALSASLFVTLECGAVLPLTRYRFVFLNPDTPVHDVPAVSAEAGLRIGAGF
jgi:hypothetical protein